MITGLCEKLVSLIPSDVKPVFIGEVPSQSEEGVALYPNDEEVRYYFFGQTDSIHIPYIQCKIRTNKYLKGEEYADKVTNAINGYTDEENILCVRQSGYLAYLGKNVDKLHEFQLTFKVILKE